NVKIISNISPNMASVFMDVGLSNVRRIENSFPLVVIKDRKEMVHVIRERNKNETAALWTDSTALIESIVVLFSMLWKDVDGSK
ncbi:MAG: hypothetical protein QW178_04450, partial [Candidatus Nitrosocaldus sp.]